MPGQSRPFFELSAASALSRALRRKEERVVPDVTAPPDVSPSGRLPEGAGPGLPPFETPTVRYTEELWHALLAWLENGLGAAGAFAMDERGFPIAQIGETGTTPPEVLLAAFTSVAQLLETYLGEAHPVRRIVVAAKGEPELVLIELDWIGESILIGTVGGRPPSTDEVSTIVETVQNQLRRGAEHPPSTET